MFQFAAGFGTILAIASIFFMILAPFALYAAQKWAYKTYLEVKKLNENIEKMVKK